MIELLASVLLFSFFTIFLTRSVYMFHHTIEISKSKVHIMNKGIVYSNIIAKDLQSLPVNSASKCGADCISFNNDEYIIEIIDGVLTTGSISSLGVLNVLASSSTEIYCLNNGNTCNDGVAEIKMIFEYKGQSEEFKITNRIGVN